jgi:DNA adenine methylase
MTSEFEPLTPFVKWAGGKRWAADTLAALIDPLLAITGGRYFEPFLGGGAVALALRSGNAQTLGDFCAPLTGLWWWLRRDAAALVDAIDLSWDNTKDGYYYIRHQFNEHGHFSAKDPTPSARMLWLNHSCFNGLYRENADGGFNVPWGKRKSIAIPSRERLIAIQDRLWNTSIQIGQDFAETLRRVREGDVVFADPPYDGTFADYTSAGFGPPEQERLAGVLDGCRRVGATVLMTNSDTPRIRSLYPEKDWIVKPLVEPRSVAADSDKRQDVVCLLVRSR